MSVRRVLIGLSFPKKNNKKDTKLPSSFLSEKLSKYEAGKAEASGEAVTSEVHVDWNNCDDISIIGAGIGGAYAAYRLKDIGKKITIFEYSDRIGGRCYTGQLTDVPDVNVEYGAMRFTPEGKHVLCSP